MSWWNKVDYTPEGDEDFESVHYSYILGGDYSYTCEYCWRCYNVRGRVVKLPDQDWFSRDSAEKWKRQSRL
jgi:hypothetical protein